MEMLLGCSRLLSRCLAQHLQALMTSKRHAWDSLTTRAQHTPVHSCTWSVPCRMARQPHNLARCPSQQLQCCHPCCLQRYPCSTQQCSTPLPQICLGQHLLDQAPSHTPCHFILARRHKAISHQPHPLRIWLGLQCWLLRRPIRLPDRQCQMLLQWLCTHLAFLQEDLGRSQLPQQSGRVSSQISRHWTDS